MAANGLSQAASALHAALAPFGGETVVVSRGGATVTVTGVLPGKPELIEDTSIGGGQIETEQLDFTLLAAQYSPGGTVSRPRQGDVLQRVNGERYQLMMPPFRAADGPGIRLRLHGRRIDG